MGWIRERIVSEYAKHGNKIDWALIAEKKILSQIDSIIDNMNCINEIHLDTKSKTRIHAGKCGEKELKAWEVKEVIRKPDGGRT